MSAKAGAHLRLAALDRALAASAVLSSGTAGTDISWTMLAAIGIRETGFVDMQERDGTGVGVGVFQFTNGGGAGA